MLGVLFSYTNISSIRNELELNSSDKEIQRGIDNHELIPINVKSIKELLFDGRYGIVIRL